MSQKSQLLDIVHAHPGLTEAEIVSHLPEHDGRHRLSPTCTRLIQEGALRREGAGTVAEPYRYFIAKPL